MILLIDNYDSFTYNLYQILSEISPGPVLVARNNRITLEEIEAMRPERIVVSPGPGRPEEAGVSVEAIRRFSGKLPILGVCLGHQAIGQAFGGRVVRNRRIVHGKASPVLHRGRGIYRGIPSPFQAGRYHSLVVERRSLPPPLAVTSWTREGEIMGLSHRRLDVQGVQFHPESILTEHGKTLLGNWLRGLGGRRP